MICGVRPPKASLRTRAIPAAASAHELELLMPWSPEDAERHTHKATTWELQELWAKVANECLERTGDEGRAIREANAVIARQAQAGYDDPYEKRR